MSVDTRVNGIGGRILIRIGVVQTRRSMMTKCASIVTTDAQAQPEIARPSRTGSTYQTTARKWQRPPTSTKTCHIA